MSECIKEVIESLPRDTQARFDAINDVLTCLRWGETLGKKLYYIEELFDYWLWNPDPKDNLAYVIALGEIEECLVLKDLI